MQTSLQTDLPITDILHGDLNLSSPPGVYFELKKIIDDSTKSLTDAAFILEKDSALTSKLLKIVNSAFFGFPATIASVERAMTIIGAQELQNLVLGAVIVERFSDLPGDTMTMHDFWARSVKCALIAREIDVHLGKQFKESVFVCGLLHDVGQLVFYKRIPSLAREVDLRLRSSAETFFEDEYRIETELIGFDHFQTGAELCRLWKLPDIISESIGLHYFPDNTESFYQIAAIVRLANYFCKLDISHDPVISNTLGITEQELAMILEKSYEQFEEIFKLFYSG